MTQEGLPHNALANPGRPRSKPPLWSAPTQPIRRAIVAPPLAVLIALHRAYLRSLADRHARGRGRNGR